MKGYSSNGLLSDDYLSTTKDKMKSGDDNMEEPLSDYMDPWTGNEVYQVFE